MLLPISFPRSKSGELSLEVAGIISMPAKIWYVPGKDTETKFQCIAVTNDDYTEIKGFGPQTGEVS